MDGGIDREAEIGEGEQGGEESPRAEARGGECGLDDRLVGETGDQPVVPDRQSIHGQ